MQAYNSSLKSLFSFARAINNYLKIAQYSQLSALFLSLSLPLHPSFITKLNICNCAVVIYGKA